MGSPVFKSESHLSLLNNVSVSSGTYWEVRHPSHTFVFMDSVISFPLGATEGAVRCLGNTLMYYKQFSEAVEQAIQKLVAPVEKEFNVREPVICRAFFAPSVKSLVKHPSIIMRVYSIFRLSLKLVTLQRS